MRSSSASAHGTRAFADLVASPLTHLPSPAVLFTPVRRLRLVALLAGVTTAWVASLPATASERLFVALDRSEVLRVDGAKTVLLADPTIAQARVQDGSTLVVQGMRNGTTNMIVLDAQGDEIGNSLITVRAASHDLARAVR